MKRIIVTKVPQHQMAHVGHDDFLGYLVAA
jgi:hypothetical protein